jgi:hypothetical protein
VSHTAATQSTESATAYARNGLSGGAIGGIVVGCLLGLAIVIGSLFACIIFTKRQRENSHATPNMAHYYDDPELVTKKPAPHTGHEVNVVPELDGTTVQPDAELDGQPRTYMPPALPVAELDGRAQVATPQRYSPQAFALEAVDPHLAVSQMMAPPMDAPHLVPPEMQPPQTVFPETVAPDVHIVETPATVAAVAELPEAVMEQQPSPLSQATAQSAAEGLARLREEELALEKRRKLLLELQEVEQKRQEISDRLAGLQGGQ